jgi:hypothetical protein
MVVTCQQKGDRHAVSKKGRCLFGFNVDSMHFSTGADLCRRAAGRNKGKRKSAATTTAPGLVYFLDIGYCPFLTKSEASSKSLVTLWLRVFGGLPI